MQTTKCYFEDGFHDTKIYLLEELSAGHTIDGPAIIVDKNRSVTCSRGYVIFFLSASLLSYVSQSSLDKSS